MFECARLPVFVGLRLRDWVGSARRGTAGGRGVGGAAEGAGAGVEGGRGDGAGGAGVGGAGASADGLVGSGGWWRLTKSATSSSSEPRSPRLSSSKTLPNMSLRPLSASGRGLIGHQRGRGRCG